MGREISFEAVRIQTSIKLSKGSKALRKDQNPDAGHGSGVALPVGAQKPGSTGEQCCGSESPVCSMHSLAMQLSPTVPAGQAANASIVQTGQRA